MRSVSKKYTKTLLASSAAVATMLFSLATASAQSRDDDTLFRVSVFVLGIMIPVALVAAAVLISPL